MIDACVGKFPGIEFYCIDASDLSRFADASFDTVVFAFNGIDFLMTPAARARCFAEVKRVLRTGGLFIFSSHHARSIFIRPRLRGASLKKRAWRIARALTLSFPLTLRTLSSVAFWKGEGYIIDPVHGGLMTYVSTPEVIRAQTSATGLRMLEIVDALHPEQGGRFFAPWYYYVLSSQGDNR
jgi:SAM-dependent methyltransferase